MLCVCDEKMIYYYKAVWYNVSSWAGYLYKRSKRRYAINCPSSDLDKILLKNILNICNIKKKN